MYSEIIASTAGNVPLSAVPLSTVRRNSMPSPWQAVSRALNREASEYFDQSNKDTAEFVFGQTKVAPFCVEVFLGGSCNPTQWRRDVAIPSLEKAGVTYYNPQQADWRPELIEIENVAKENTKTLFFVHDKDTRGLVSMVESGEISGKRRPLVLAIEDQGSHVMQEALTSLELTEMNRARNYLRDIADNCCIKVHSTVSSAIEFCIDAVKTPSKLALSLKDRATQIFNESLQENNIKMRSAFDNFATNQQLSIAERKLAFRMVTNRELSKEFLMADVRLINFEQFCLIVSEYKMSTKTRCQWVSNIFASNFPKEQPSPKTRDIFLGGPDGGNDWRSNVAFPALKKHNLSYGQIEEGNDRLDEEQINSIENCKVLLFVFPKDSRGAADMILASHYIGAGYKVVLCIQNLKEGTIVHGEKLSIYQTKDYNRGRMYLADQATRSGIPIFEDINEAVDTAVKMTKESRKPSFKLRKRPSFTKKPLTWLQQSMNFRQSSTNATALSV